MKTNTSRDNRSVGIEYTKNVNLSSAAGRRLRIRELLQLHETVTVGEIIKEMNRSVETNRSEIMGTLSGLERAGFVIILDAENMADREVRMV
jgi:hypothetical protein